MSEETELERLRALVVATSNDLNDARYERDQLELLLSKVEARLNSYPDGYESIEAFIKDLTEENSTYTYQLAETRALLRLTLGSWPDDLAMRIRATLDESADAEQRWNEHYSSLSAYRQAAAALRVAWDRMTACYDEFGALGALDACAEYQDLLDTAILAVLAIGQDE